MMMVAAAHVLAILKNTPLKKNPLFESPITKPSRYPINWRFTWVLHSKIHSDWMQRIPHEFQEDHINPAKVTGGF